MFLAHAGVYKVAPILLILLIHQLFIIITFNWILLVKFLNCAARVVKYCQDQPVLHEVTQSRFLKAKTMSRSYFHVTKELVEVGCDLKHEVETLKGKT